MVLGTPRCGCQEFRPPICWLSNLQQNRTHHRKLQYVSPTCVFRQKKELVFVSVCPNKNPSDQFGDCQVTQEERLVSIQTNACSMIIFTHNSRCSWMFVAFEHGYVLLILLYSKWWFSITNSPIGPAKRLGFLRSTGSGRASQDSRKMLGAKGRFAFLSGDGMSLQGDGSFKDSGCWDIKYIKQHK